MGGATNEPAHKRVKIEGSPSKTNKYSDIKEFLPTTLRAEHDVALYTLRPVATDVDIAPPVLAKYPPFGLIHDAAYKCGDVQGVLPAHWYQAAQMLCGVSAAIFEQEDHRQHALLWCLKEMWPGTHFGPANSTDGSMLVSGAGGDYLVANIEVNSSGDAGLQGQRYVQKWYEADARWAQDFVLRATGAPALVISMAGPTMGVYGVYIKHTSVVVCEPLAPVLHLVSLVNRQSSHLHQLAHVLAACYVVLRWLEDAYRATGPFAPVPSPRRSTRLPPPLPQLTARSSTKRREDKELAAAALRGLARSGIDFSAVLAATTLTREQLQAAAKARGARQWPLPCILLGGAFSNVTWLGFEGKLLFQAQYHTATYSGAVVIKFSVSLYPAQIHQAWQAEGLAPALVECMHLPGGGSLVIIEHLREEDGWQMLCCLQGDKQDAAFEAATVAMERAHTVRIPVGGSSSSGSSGAAVAVHGDMRGPNIMVRQQGDVGSWQVKFIDFDWAGIAGSGRYPASLSSAYGWHEGAKAGQQMQQEHDKILMLELGKLGAVSQS